MEAGIIGGQIQEENWGQSKITIKENWGQSKITIMRIPKTVFQAVQRESGRMYLMGLLGVRFNAVHLTTHMQSNRRFIASPLFSTETS